MDEAIEFKRRIDALIEREQTIDPGIICPVENGGNNKENLQEIVKLNVPGKSLNY